MGSGNGKVRIVNSRDSLKRLRNVAGDAVIAASALLELAEGDIVGSIPVGQGNVEDEVRELLRLARELRPGQELVVVVMSKPKGKEDRNAEGTQHRPGARRGRDRLHDRR